MDWILSDSIPTDLRHTVWGIVSFIVSGSFHNLLEVNEKQLHTFFMTPHLNHMSKFIELQSGSLLEKDALNELANAMSSLESAAKSMRKFIVKNETCNTPHIDSKIADFEESLINASTYLCDLIIADGYLPIEEKNNILLDTHDECRERLKIKDFPKKAYAHKTIIEELDDKTTVLTQELK